MTEKIVMTNSGEATAAIFGAFDMNVRMIVALNMFDTVGYSLVRSPRRSSLT